MPKQPARGPFVVGEASDVSEEVAVGGDREAEPLALAVGEEILPDLSIRPFGTRER